MALVTPEGGALPSQGDQSLREMLPLPNPARGNPHGLGDGSRAFDVIKASEVLEAAQQARLPVGVSCLAVAPISVAWTPVRFVL